MARPGPTTAAVAVQELITPLPDNDVLLEATAWGDYYCTKQPQ